MKRILTLLLALLLVFSLAACGGGGDEKTPSSGDKTPSSSGQQQQNTPVPDPGTNKPDEPSETPVPDEDGDPIDLSGYLGTKTGRFYSQFADGRMYMEYEMEMEGQTMTVISATDGDRTYSETRMGGTSMGVSIMEGETMYTIDHENRMVIKMAVGADAETIAGAVLEESDVDFDALQTGTVELDGKTYDTEEWAIEGITTIFCFDGDELAYMFTDFAGEEVVMKIVEVSDRVDDSLFEIPEDYTMTEF